MATGPVELAAVESIAVFPIRPGLRIAVECQATPPPASAEPIWTELCAANPRLHDSPVLAVTRVDPAAAEIGCEIASYKAFVTGREVGKPVWALGVTGVLWHRSPRGAHVLFGRRGKNVRKYASLWETAPRGGARPPLAPGVLPADYPALEVHHEAMEELGSSFPVPPLTPIAVVVDPHASSIDVVLSGELGGPVRASPASWEYSGLRWIDLSTIPGGDARLSPPTAALLEALRSGVLALTSAAST